jgi:hypothetical protein
MKIRTMLIVGILLTGLFSFGCATGGHDYNSPQYYPDYQHNDYDPFHPYQPYPSEQRREELHGRQLQGN